MKLDESRVFGANNAAGLPRDRLTWLVYFQTGVYGSFGFAIGPVVPLLGREQGILQSVAGLHGTALAVGGALAGFLVRPVVGRWGKAATLWAGLVVLCLGLVLFLSTTYLPATLFGVLVANVGGIVTLTVGTATLYERLGGAGEAAAAEAHALSAFVGVGASLLLGLSISAGFGWRPALMLPIVFTVVLALLLGRTPVPNGLAHTAVSAERHPSRRRFGLSITVHVACIMIEFCMGFWMVGLLASQTKIGPGTATLGFTVMMLGVAIGRAAGSRLALRYAPDTLLLTALGTSALGWFVFWISTSPAVSFVALLVCGAGIALQYPLSIMRVIKSFHGYPERAGGYASIATGVGQGAGPSIMGALADIFGTHGAFLLIPFLHGIAIFGLLASRLPGRKSGQALRIRSSAGVS
jgi:predicted MFS family arabinose efflux permease